MREAPLTTLKGGIDRQRLKGGARADVLYDFVNGYLTDAGTARSRPGSQRIAKLDAATRGLVSFDGSLHTFCHKAVYVPDGFSLDILVRPDKIIEGDPQATFTLLAGQQIEGGTAFTGADTTDFVVTTPYGSFTDAVLAGTLEVVAMYCGSVPDSSYPNQGIFEFILEDYGAPAAVDAFTSVTFTDASSVQRTFLRADAINATTLVSEPDGVEVGTGRIWSWLIDPAAPVLATGETYEVTFNGVGTENATSTTPGENFELKKIHFAQPFMGALYVVAEFDDDSVFHYWLQPGEQWAADTVYKAGDLVYPATPTGFVYRAKRAGSANPPWAANALRYDGTTSGYEASVIEPTVYNDYYYTCIATTGASPRSGETEPDWPTVDGATVIESTDNPPDVNIPTTTVEGGTNTPTSPTKDRYGSLNDAVRAVLR